MMCTTIPHSPYLQLGLATGMLTRLKKRELVVIVAVLVDTDLGSTGPLMLIHLWQVDEALKHLRVVDLTDTVAFGTATKRAAWVM